MKKFFLRILGIFSILILGYQQFCYADVMPTTSEILFVPITFLVGFIGVIILLISAISFFSLKATVRKQNIPEYDSDKLKKISSEEIENKKNKIQRRFYFWGMILAIIGLIYLSLVKKFSVVVLFIPIILFIVSFIVRLNKNKKVSNIIWAISIVFICLMGIWTGLSNKMIKDYNKQFLQYQKIESNSGVTYVSDAEGLINTAIENNKSGRKTTFIYQNINYTSPNQLKLLLSKLNNEKLYSLNVEYDSNDYIESITLTSYVNPYLYYLKAYEGSQKRSGEVILLIQSARTEALRNEDIKVNIIYTSETGQKTTININADTFENITNLRKQIEGGKTYNVEFLTEANGICNIIITTNV